jgi:hypothetical protein
VAVNGGFDGAVVGWIGLLPNFCPDVGPVAGCLVPARSRRGRVGQAELRANGRRPRAARPRRTRSRLFALRGKIRERVCPRWRVRQASRPPRELAGRSPRSTVGVRPRRRGVRLPRAVGAVRGWGECGCGGRRCWLGCPSTPSGCAGSGRCRSCPAHRDRRGQSGLWGPP